MSVNPYRYPIPDAPAEASAGNESIAFACAILATFCGLYFVCAAVATLVTAKAVSLPAAAVAASGVGAWSLL